MGTRDNAVGTVAVYEMQPNTLLPILQKDLFWLRFGLLRKKDFGVQAYFAEKSSYSMDQIIIQPLYMIGAGLYNDTSVWSP